MEETSGSGSLTAEGWIQVDSETGQILFNFDNIPGLRDIKKLIDENLEQIWKELENQAEVLDKIWPEEWLEGYAIVLSGKLFLFCRGLISAFVPETVLNRISEMFPGGGCDCGKKDCDKGACHRESSNLISRFAALLSDYINKKGAEAGFIKEKTRAAMEKAVAFGKEGFDSREKELLERLINGKMTVSDLLVFKERLMEKKEAAEQKNDIVPTALFISFIIKILAPDEERLRWD